MRELVNFNFVLVIVVCFCFCQIPAVLSFRRPRRYFNQQWVGGNQISPGLTQMLLKQRSNRVKNSYSTNFKRLFIQVVLGIGIKFQLFDFQNIAALRPYNFTALRAGK